MLSDLGLAEVDRPSEASEVESMGYGMHNCVHSWTIHVLNQEWDPETAGLVLECVGLHEPDKNTHKSWVARRRLMRHAARCGGLVLNGMAKNKRRERALRNLGDMFSDEGRLDKTELMYQRALHGKEKALSPEHTSTLDTVNNISKLLHLQLNPFQSSKMRQARAREEEVRLEVEKRLTLKGTARIRLDQPCFPWNDAKELNKKNVDRLKAIFQQLGCRRQDLQHPMPAIIDESQLDASNDQEREHILTELLLVN